MIQALLIIHLKMIMIIRTKYSIKIMNPHLTKVMIKITEYKIFIDILSFFNIFDYFRSVNNK